MDMADASSSSLEEEFRLAQRSSYLRIDLEAVLHNVRVLRSLCSSHTEVMAVLKANATGHGSVAIATHLVNNGIKHFAVATAAEGRDLREAGIQVYIQVFGTSHEDVDILQKFQLTPTVSTPAFLRLWATKHRNANLTVPPVVIKIDTGMSRHGCQPEELQQMMKTSEELGIPVHSLMTHFAVAWEDAEVTQCQLDLFLDTVRPYREQGVKVHVANAPAIIRGFGADLDFVRPGISIYGLPPDMSEEGVDVVQELGLKPALSWIVRPTLIKTLPAGRSVGYGHTYRLQKTETIATFNIGYADGYSRELSGKGVLTTVNGDELPVVGRVSMDAITVKMDASFTDLSSAFYVYSDVISHPNSVTNIARALGTIPQEVCSRLSARLPRVYVTGGRHHVPGLRNGHLRHSDQRSW